MGTGVGAFVGGGLRAGSLWHSVTLSVVIGSLRLAGGASKWPLRQVSIGGPGLSESSRCARVSHTGRCARGCCCAVLLG